jgi:hypothetical protein
MGARLVWEMHGGTAFDCCRWLTGVPDALKMECAGFGVNLASGNYEFA